MIFKIRIVPICRQYMCWNIRIFHRKEKSVQGSMFGIMRLCRVMPNSDPKGQIFFLSASNNHDGFLFLYTFWSSVFDFNVGSAINELCSYTLMSTILKVGPRQANLVLIAYASSEGSGEPAHPRSLARTSTARSYKQWIKRNLQTESQIPGLSEWLGMRSWNLSWRNARRHKFACRGSFNVVCDTTMMSTPNVLTTVT